MKIQILINYLKYNLKIYLSNAQFLGNGQIGVKPENKYIIYENNNFNKLFEIQFENIDNIKSVIELNNKALFFVLLLMFQSFLQLQK